MTSKADRHLAWTPQPAWPAYPHKNELELGKNLAVRFAYQHLPRHADEVEAIFRRKGAYSRFKDLLASKGALDQWYEYEAQAQEKTLRQWCEENQIKVPD